MSVADFSSSNDTATVQALAMRALVPPMFSRNCRRAETTSFATYAVVVSNSATSVVSIAISTILRLIETSRRFVRKLLILCTS